MGALLCFVQIRLLMRAFAAWAAKKGLMEGGVAVHKLKSRGR